MTDPEASDFRSAITSADNAADTALSAHVATAVDSDGDSLSYSFKGTTGTDDFNGDSVNVLAAKLADMQDDLAAYNETVAEQTGLTAAKDALVSAQSAYSDKITAEDKAENALDAEAAKFETLLGSSAAATATTTDLLTLEADDVVVSGSDAAGASADFIVVGSDGKTLEAASDSVAELNGFDALLAAAQASLNAELAEVSAEQTFEAAVADVLDIENEGWADLDGSSFTTSGAVDADGTAVTGSAEYLVTDGNGNLYFVADTDGTGTFDGTGETIYQVQSAAIADGDTVTLTVGDGNGTFDPSNYTEVSTDNTFTLTDLTFSLGSGFHSDDSFSTEFSSNATDTLNAVNTENAVSTLQDIIAVRETLLADANETQGYVDQLAELDKEVGTAEKALTDEGFTVVNLDGDKMASSKDDIYLLSSTDAEITNFNSAGEDKIFVGSDFELFFAEDGQEISGDLGSSSAIEAIVLDDGTDTSIFFESKAFAGNGSTDADTTEITLTGVTGADVSIDAEGFLSIA